MDNEILQQILDELKAQNQMRSGAATAAEETADALGQAEEAAEALAKAEAEAAKAAEMFTDAMKQSLRTLAGSLGSFATALTSTTGKFGEFGEGLDGLGDAALTAGKALGGFGLVAGLAVKAMTSVGKAALEQTDKTLEAKDSLFKLGGVGVGTGKDILQMAHSAKISSKNLELLVKPMQSMNQSFLNLGSSVADGQKKFMQMTAVTDEQRKAFGRLGFSQGELIQAQADYVNLQRASGVNLRAMGKSMDQIQKASLEYTTNLVELSALAGGDIDSAKRAKEIANTQYAELIRTRKEGMEIAHLRRAGATAEERQRADDIEARQKYRKQLIEEMSGQFGEGTGEAFAQYMATGVINDAVKPLLMQGVDLEKQRRIFNVAGNDAEKQMRARAEIAGNLAKAEQKTVNTFGDIAAIVPEVGKTFNMTQQSLVKGAQQVGADQLELRKTNKANIEAAKGEGTDPMADAREDLRETQRDVTVGLDKLLLAVNPLTTKFGLMGMAVGALAVAAGTAALALKGISGTGLGERARGLFGRGTGETTGAALPTVGGGGGAAAAGGGGGAAIVNALARAPGQALRSAAQGIQAFANPQVILGAAGLGAAITAIGAGISGASWILGKALPTLTDGLQGFNDIDGGNLTKVGLGMGAVGVGLAAFGTGGAIAGVGNLVGGLFDKIGDKLGVDGPFKKLEDFSKMDIKADKVKANAEAFTAFGKAMAAQGGGQAAAGGGRLFGGLLDKLSDKLELKGPAERLKEFGDVKIDDKTAANVKRNAEVFLAFGQAMSSFKGGGANVGDALSSWAGKKLGALPPMEQFQNFAKVTLTEAQVKQVKLNAEAFVAFSDAMSKFTGGGTAETVMGSIRQRAQRFFETEPPIVKLGRFSNTKLTEQQVKQVKINADAFVVFCDAMSKFKGIPSTGPLDSAMETLATAFGGGTQDVFDKFVEFSNLQIIDPERTKKVAEAFASYASAMALLADPKVARGQKVAAAGGGVPAIARAAGGGGGAAPGAPTGGAAGAGGGPTQAAGPEDGGHQSTGGSGGGSAGKPTLTTVKSKSGKSTAVNAEYASRFQGIIDWLENQGYKIKSLGGYVDRDVRGRPGQKSVHAHGGAIDINPQENPLGSTLVTDFPAGVSQAAANLGLGWGGNWRSRKDAMHFSVAKNEGGIGLSEGGIAIGDKQGYPATLHGKEMVIPLQGDSLLEKLGKMSESQLKQDDLGGSDKMSSAIQSMLEMNQRTSQEWISKLDTMINVLENSRTTQEKTLRAVRT